MNAGRVAAVLLPIAALVACTGGPGDPTGSSTTSGSGLPSTSSSSSSSSSSGGTTSGSSGVTAGQTSIDPSKYSKACTQDSDCDFFQALTNCGGCCGFVSVNKQSIESDYAAVKANCVGKAGIMCNIACQNGNPKCNGGQCGSDLTR
jgi:hypothetical protein